MEMQPFDPTRPVVVYRCAAEKDCGMRFWQQPNPGVEPPYSPPDPEKFWCSGCGVMRMGMTDTDGLQLNLLAKPAP